MTIPDPFKTANSPSSSALSPEAGESGDLRETELPERADFDRLASAIEAQNPNIDLLIEVIGRFRTSVSASINSECRRYALDLLDEMLLDPLQAVAAECPVHPRRFADERVDGC